MTTAKVILWGTDIGAITWLDNRGIGVFQYMPSFLNSGIEIAPLMMPLREFPYEFPALSKDTFRGLPGLLSDSLPDKFGNALIDAWLASENRKAASFNPVERLCYIGTRGIGALEFEPSHHGPSTIEKELEIASLVKLANAILNERSNLKGQFSGTDDQEVLEDILRVGTSAGGARAKALLAWNPITNEFRSGQVEVDSDYEHWLLKFDGVANNRDKEIADPLGYGRIEFAYYLMAVDASIVMMESRLHEEGGRSHFMTKRFDRTDAKSKLHKQTLGAIAHFDFNQPADYSYEQAIQVIKRLGLSREDIEQQIIRAYFNVIARNQDDHVKNIAFLMDRTGTWKLSPAYDMTYAYRPDGAWTNQHQMSINGKRDDFSRSDLIKLAEIGGIKQSRANELIDQVLYSVSKWPDFAADAEIDGMTIDRIQNSHRLGL